MWFHSGGVVVMFKSELHNSTLTRVLKSVMSCFLHSDHWQLLLFGALNLTKSTISCQQCTSLCLSFLCGNDFLHVVFNISSHERAKRTLTVHTSLSRSSKPLFILITAQLWWLNGRSEGKKQHKRPNRCGEWTGVHIQFQFTPQNMCCASRRLLTITATYADYK